MVLLARIGVEKCAGCQETLAKAGFCPFS